jgi:hypothetical protein
MDFGVRFWGGGVVRIRGVLPDRHERGIIVDHPLLVKAIGDKLLNLEFIGFAILENQFFNLLESLILNGQSKGIRFQLKFIGPFGVDRG